MNWFRKSFPFLAFVCLSTAVVGQEPAPPSGKTSAVGVSLGRSTPIGNDPAAGASGASAFVPIRAASFSSAMPRQPIVRACAILEDEPQRFFLPRELPLMSETGGMRTVQAIQPIPPKEKAKIIEIDKLPTIPLPPIRNLPGVSSVPGVEGGPGDGIIIIDEGETIFVDEAGYPLFGFGDRPDQWYGQAEWLSWWTKGFQLPPLVTTAAATDPELTRAALGFGTTRIIFGGGPTSSDSRSGGRFTVGRWLDPERSTSVDVTYMFLANKTDTFLAKSDQFPVIGRPFFNINENRQDRELTTSPGTNLGDAFKAIGSTRVDMRSKLWGLEGNARRILSEGECGRITGMIGVRYLHLHEQLNITEDILAQRAIAVVPPAVPIRVGDRITVFDGFDTRNNFFGGQIGLNAELMRGRWSLDTRVKIAFGATEQTVNIAGSQSIVSTNGARQDFQGGLYAVTSNIGQHSQTRFAVVPEVGVKLGYNLTENVRLFVGYDFMYWSNVLRPGDQIDQTIDANLIPNFTGGGPLPRAPQVRPIVPFRTTGYWAQGCNAGLVLRY
jgi:hypothetical protein